MPSYVDTLKTGHILPAPEGISDSVGYNRDAVHINGMGFRLFQKRRVV
jgi:hypothetical protein